MKTFLLLICIFFFISCSQNKSENLENEHPSFFSVKEIQESDSKYVAPLDFIQATDNTSLAFRAYFPEHSKAILIFYHGAGAHSGLTYNHIGVGLADEYQIGFITPDLRGHGASGGDRGDAPSDEQVWEDISTMINYAHQKYENFPYF